jgi:hypothetical protein
MDLETIARKVRERKYKDIEAVVAMLSWLSITVVPILGSPMFDG